MGKTVLTTGVFDCGMHIGHFLLLQTCREIAGPDGKVIIGVNSDHSAESYKRKPLFNEYDRIQYVHALRMGTVIDIQFENDIEKAIDEYKVDFYVKGSEWADKKVTGEHKCKIILLKPFLDFAGHKFSTSTIIDRIIKNAPIPPTPQTVLESAKKDSLI